VHFKGSGSLTFTPDSASLARDLKTALENQPNVSLTVSVPAKGSKTTSGSGDDDGTSVVSGGTGQGKKEAKEESSTVNVEVERVELRQVVDEKAWKVAIGWYREDASWNKDGEVLRVGSSWTARHRRRQTALL
jgi:hypothetical protein